METKKPNILFIFADDWGFGDLGCYGHPELKTPHLDRLASQGTRFMQFHVSSGVCSPSRCTVMTGHYPARHSIHGHFARYDFNEARHMPNMLNPHVHTLPKLLRSGGYRTAHFGKWHLGGGGGVHGHPDAPAPAEYGYDETRVWNGNGPTWLGRKHWPFALHNDLDEDFLPYSDGLAVEEAIRFIDKDRDKPFFINLWLRAPHTPLRATKEQRLPYAHVEEPKQTYYSVLTEADRQIGRLLDRMDQLALTDRTVVMFSSDNGPETAKPGNPETRYCQGSTGGLRGRKRSLYEGGIRVPFIVRWPGATPTDAVDDDTLLSSADLLPTLCGIAGVSLPEDLQPDGVDMKEALLGRSFVRPKPIMWEWRFANLSDHSRESPMHAIREGDYVLLRNPDGNRVELYDIRKDGAQSFNIAVAHPDKVADLSRQLDCWTTQLPPLRQSSPDAPEE